MGGHRPHVECIIEGATPKDAPRNENMRERGSSAKHGFGRGTTFLAQQKKRKLIYLLAGVASTLVVYGRHFLSFRILFLFLQRGPFSPKTPKTERIFFCVALCAFFCAGFKLLRCGWRRMGEARKETTFSLLPPCNRLAARGSQFCGLWRYLISSVAIL